MLNLGDIISNPKAQSGYVELLYNLCSIMTSAEAYGMFAQGCAIVNFLLLL